MVAAGTAGQWRQDGSSRNSRQQRQDGSSRNSRQQQEGSKEHQEQQINNGRRVATGTAVQRLTAGG